MDAALLETPIPFELTENPTGGVPRPLYGPWLLQPIKCRSNPKLFDFAFANRTILTTFRFVDERSLDVAL